MVADRRNLRLIVNRKLVRHQCVPQCRFQRLAAAQPLVHASLEKAGAIATVELRPVESDIRILQDSGGVTAVSRDLCDPDAGTHHGFRPLDLEGIGKAGQNALAQSLHIAGSGNAGHQYRKLVAAEPRHQISLTHAVAQSLGAVHQHLVSGCMAQTVVDFLEAIEVDAEHRGALAAAVHALQDLGQMVVESYPVGQSGERVMTGQKLNLAERGRRRYVRRRAR